MFRFALHLDSRLAQKEKNRHGSMLMSLKEKCIASVARHGLKEGALIDLNNSWLLLEEIRLELQQKFDEFEE